jgi:hypothetical protein
MALADWIRASLWGLTDWPAALHQLCERESPETEPARAAELAEACELIDPARERAFAMRQLAWQRGGEIADLHRAFELARELGDHIKLAALAVAAHEATRDPEYLVIAGVAFLDGDHPDEAEPLLARAAHLLPQNEEPKSALSMLMHKTRDPQAEISMWVARATRASGADAGRLYMHAARLARLAGFDDIYARHLQAAFQRGQHPAAMMLLEAQLVAERRANDLLAFYRTRVEAARSDHRFADLMRAAGMTLHRHGVQRGLAVRVLRNSLEAAYRARIADVPGHLATWDVLIRYARDTRSTRELMPLVVEAMALPLDADARLYIARFGFDVTSREANDQHAARAYASVIAELVPASGTTVIEPTTAPLPPEPSFVKLKPGLPAKPRAPTQDPRIAPRVVLPADVDIVLGSERITAIVRDISATGIYLITERELDVETTVQLEVELPVAKGALEVAIHVLTARIVRRAFTGYGLELVSPPAAFAANLASLQEL